MEVRMISVAGVLTLDIFLVFISNCMAFPGKLSESDAMDRLQKPISQFTNHQRQYTDSSIKETVSNLVYDLNEINKMSERTFFSDSIPDMPPRAYLPVEYNSNLNSSVHSRQRRSSHESLLSVCDQLTTWTRKKWAMSYYGENVTVVERIQTFDKGHTSQFFFETSCSKKGGANKNGCRGIDATYYSSECKTKESYVYAIVRNKHGQEGWNWIAINSSCDCALTLMPKLHRMRHHRNRCRRPLQRPS